MNNYLSDIEENALSLLEHYKHISDNHIEEFLVDIITKASLLKSDKKEAYQ